MKDMVGFKVLYHSFRIPAITNIFVRSKVCLEGQYCLVCEDILLVSLVDFQCVSTNDINVIENAIS